MTTSLELIAVIASGVSALVSAVSAFWAVRTAQLARRVLESKEGPIPSGPEIEEVSTELVEREEGDR